MVTEGFAGVERKTRAEGRALWRSRSPPFLFPDSLSPSGTGEALCVLPSVVCRCALDRKKAGGQAGDKLNFGGALAPAARSFYGTEKRGKFYLRGFSPGPWLALRSGQTRAWRYTAEATRGAEEIDSEYESEFLGLSRSADQVSISGEQKKRPPSQGGNPREVFKVKVMLIHVSASVKTPRFDG
jgi:hypothetical protein